MQDKESLSLTVSFRWMGILLLQIRYMNQLKNIMHMFILMNAMHLVLLAKMVMELLNYLDLKEKQILLVQLWVNLWGVLLVVSLLLMARLSICFEIRLELICFQIQLLHLLLEPLSKHIICSMKVLNQSTNFIKIPNNSEAR